MRLVIDTDLIKNYIEKNKVLNVVCDGVSVNNLVIDDEQLWYPCYKGHFYDDVITAPTCTEKGYTTHTCSKCDHSYKDNYTDALGHTSSDWIVDTEPTTATEGSKHKECTVCGEILETATIPKLEPLTYTLSSDGTYYSVKATDKYVSGDITIDSKYNGIDVTTIGSYAFDDCNSIISVVIPDSVTYIGVEAFQSCDSLTSVTIGNSVTSIGEYAFSDCDSLTSVIIPDSVTSIGDRAFFHCDSLTSVIIGNGVTSIGEYAFYGVSEVYYNGTEEEWSKITIDSLAFIDATRYYYRENHPIEEGEFWHYIDGVPTAWCCDIVVDEAVAPTCTKTGLTEGSHCGVCGTVLVAQTTVAALGHSYGEWTITLEPTCTETGTKRRDCKNCTDYETETVAALGHKYSGVVTPPTCTEKGYTTQTCTVCGHSYVDNITDARGHNYESVVTAPTCTEKGYTTHTCSKCGDSYKDTYVDELGHDYVIVKTLPTCTEQGYTSYTCTRCDHSYVGDIVAATGHSYTSVVTEPTCTAKGYTTHTCKCGDSYKDTYVEALGHSYGAPTYTWNETNTACTAIRTCVNDASHTETSNAHSISSNTTKDATCSATGTKVYTAAFSAGWAGTHTKTEILPKVPTAHSWKTPTYTWSDYTACTATRVCAYNSSHTETAIGLITSAVTKEETCTTDGTRTYTATFDKTWASNQTKTETIPATGHTVVTDAAVAPTCTKTGLTEGKHCSRCNEVLVAQTTVAANGHKYEGVVTAPTCTERGYTTYTCHCGDSYNYHYVDALGHNWGEWTVTLEPTCTETGTQESRCSVCGDIGVETIAALGHKYEDVIVAATCTKDGYKTSACTVCGSEQGYRIIIPATGHSYTSVVTAPTCTEQGYTTHTCTNGCGDSYVDTYTDATGHTWGAWSIVTKPTCTKAGSNRRTCSVCSAIDTQIVAAKGHSWNAPTYSWNGYSSCTATRVCSNDSSHTETATATITNVVTTAATCTTAGVRTYTATFSESWAATQTKTETISAIGHDYKVTQNTAQNCVKDGCIVYTCSNCGDTYTEVIPADGVHSNSFIRNVEPTCTEKGYALYICDDCGAETRKDYVEALGHDWDTEVEVIPPTCTEQGYTIHTCNACGETYKDSFTDALGHTESEWIIDVEATETADGSKHKECTVCGVVLETATIPKLDNNTYLLTESGEYLTDEQGNLLMI